MNIESKWSAAMMTLSQSTRVSGGTGMNGNKHTCHDCPGYQYYEIVLKSDDLLHPNPLVRHQPIVTVGF